MSGVEIVEGRGRWLVAVGLLAAAFLGGCKSFLDPYPPAQVISDTKFDPSLGVDLSKMTVTDDGLYYQDVVVGTGTEVTVMDTVSVDITGWLSDGTQVVTGTDEPLLVAGGLIPGLVEGLLGMKEGGERLLLVPSDLAYGDLGKGAVPGGAIIVFDVTVKQVGGVALSSGGGVGG